MTQTDKTENCPVCENKIKDHTVQNFIDCIEDSNGFVDFCIEKLFEKNEDNHLEINPSSAKNQEALKQIDGLLASTTVKRVMITPEIALQDVLEKLKETLT